MRTIPIEILASHISEGVPMSPCGCPVARAASAMFPGFGIAVGIRGLTIGSHDCIMRDDAADFAKDFDAHRRVHPCTVHIEVPDDLEIP